MGFDDVDVSIVGDWYEIFGFVGGNVVSVIRV